MRNQQNEAQAPIDADRLLERGNLMLKGLSETLTRLDIIADRLIGPCPQDANEGKGDRPVTSIRSQLEDAHMFIKRLDGTLNRIEVRL